MIHMLRAAAGAVSAYAAHPDPRVREANLVALLVASNQPFYPLSIALFVGLPVWPAFVTFLSTPLFLAVPAIARRHPLAGRALVPIAGIANTMLACKAFGVGSGVEIFLLPCVLLALLPFRQSERAVAFALAGLAAVPYLLLHDRYGPPLHLYDPAQYAAFVRMNAVSAGMLCAFVALRFSQLVADERASDDRR